MAVLRTLADGRFHSGEHMAQQLGCSRASIWQAVENLSQLYGARIFRVRGKGYRLPAPLVWLDPQAIAAETSGWQVEVAEHIDSSNSALLTRAAQGAPHRLALFAEIQTAGRGRRGRQWISHPGEALTFSILWRFDCGVAGLSGLSLVVGIALTRVLNRLEIPVRLKWPNDILLGERKAAGILIELAGDTLGPSAVVIGIGINLADPGEVGQAAAGLADAHRTLPPRNVLAAALLNELTAVLTTFAQAGFAPFQEEWQSWHAFQEQTVWIISPYAPPLEGRALGVDAHGALRLWGHDGEQRIHAGEVSLRPHL